MQNLSDVVDITSDNFTLMLPLIGEAVEKCDFIAFDLEFSGTGVQPYYKSVQSDTMETRYAKAKSSVDMFYPLQIGMCFFKWSSKRQSWTCKPFNFYLRPYTHKYLQSKIIFSSSTVSFLHENHFDFNKSLTSGIYTLRYTDENNILRKINEESEFQEYKDDNDYKFIQSFMDTVNKWVLDVKQKQSTLLLKTIQEMDDKQTEEDTEDYLVSQLSPLQLHEEQEGVDYIFTPPCPYHTRKLIKQEVEEHYPKLFVCEREEDNIGIKPKLQRWRIYRHQYTRDLNSLPKKSPLSKMPSAALQINYQQGTALEKDPGMRRVLELIITHKKPLIGFECLLDITFTFGSMYDYLQDTCSDFISFLHERLPTLIDIKVIMEEPKMIEYFTNICSLGNAYHIVSTHEDFKNPHIGMYNSENTVVPHDASNDAYMTGYLYIKLAEYYGLTYSDIRNTMKITNNYVKELKNLFVPNYETKRPENWEENPIQPAVFTSSYNYIHLHRFQYSIPLYNNEFNKLQQYMDRRNVLLLSNIPSYFNRELMRKLFTNNNIPCTKDIIFEFLDSSYCLATFPSSEIAMNVYSLWKESCKQTNIISPKNEFSFSQLQIDFYYVYETLCSVSHHITDIHKMLYEEVDENISNKEGTN